MSDNGFFSQYGFKRHGKVMKVMSLASLTEENHYFKKSPFYHWKTIVGEGLAANSCPLYADKEGKRLVVAIAHASFQIPLQFLNSKIINEIRKIKGFTNTNEIFYAIRPDLFKDNYRQDTSFQSEEERKKVVKVIKEIKKVLSDGRSLDNRQ